MNKIWIDDGIGFTSVEDAFIANVSDEELEELAEDAAHFYENMDMDSGRKVIRFGNEPYETTIADTGTTKNDRIIDDPATNGDAPEINPIFFSGHGYWVGAEMGYLVDVSDEELAHLEEHRWDYWGTGQVIEWLKGRKAIGFRDKPYPYETVVR